MLDQNALEKLRQMSQSEIKDICGQMFHINSDRAELVKYKARDIVPCFSISQFLTLIEMETQANPDTHYYVNVASFDKVWLAKRGLNRNLEIDCVATADFTKVFEPFQYGKRLTQEDFIIGVMTRFDKTAERDRLIELASSLRAGKTADSIDDGVSQVVSTQAGVHLKERAKIKAVWNLKTFKTFPEVEQPVIPYILRLHSSDDDSVPTLALYECDGGLWKVGCTIAVRDQLVKRIASKKVVVL
jgi:hypothetical protein